MKPQEGREEICCADGLSTGTVLCTSRTPPKEKRVFRCNYAGCDAAFQKPIRLQWHLKVHNGDRPYKCSIPGCSKAFTRPYHRTRHESKSHGDDLEVPGEFACPVSSCGKFLHTKQLLARHIKRLHESPGFVCSRCDKCFRQKHQLRSHEMEHTGDLPFLCTKDGCGKGFPSNSKLMRHMKLHDGYMCPVEGCGNCFSKWSLLRKHKAAEHRKLHRCSHCGKSFGRKAFLEEHLETHKNERCAVQCPDCETVLMSEKSLKVHEKRCPAKKEKLICGFPGCGKIYTRKNHFDKHKALHDLGEKFKLEIVGSNSTG
ncbi:transcription factor IIIA-like [Paramacrobiotus metropolitanus]|uniref:transcription factor IIIA-like n=1 Tax=Paramacrobiotus metropolitanus TaxID=2943436 RepID=UPI002445E1AD|nr:transcription factor IIIA-like [Paramacrobiotus metropolitanus]